MSALNDYYQDSAYIMSQLSDIKNMFREKDNLVEEKRLAEFTYDPYRFIKGSELSVKETDIEPNQQQQMEAIQFEPIKYKTNIEMQPDFSINK